MIENGFLLEGFLSFTFGLVVGSFLNSLIYRLETKKDFLRGRSFCPNCGKALAWKDLIPILSFILLKGRCRYCKEKISIQYPLVEFFTGLSFLLAFFSTLNQFSILKLIFLFLIFSLFILIFVFDAKHYSIPDILLYFAIFLSFLYYLFFNFESPISYFFFSLFPSLFFLAIILLSREKLMGFGDFTLVISLGLFLGWPKILLALFFSFFSGATVGLILIFLKKKTLKSKIPFAPFLISGALFSFFFGQKVIDFLFFSL